MILKIFKNRRIRIVLSALILCIGIAAVFLCIKVRTKFSDKIVTADALDRTVYGVVLGASINPATNGPSVTLQARLDAALDLLRARKIQGIIVTGDDGSWKSNEEKAMVDYLHAANVPDEILYVDKPAYRTFDSCAHLAHAGFSHVVLVTQAFHMPRALFLCNTLGMESVGVIAPNNSGFVRAMYDWLRDFAASPFAYFDVHGVKIIKKGPASK